MSAAVNALHSLASSLVMKRESDFSLGFTSVDFSVGGAALGAVLLTYELGRKLFSAVAGLYAGLILVPAWTTYTRLWHRLAAAFLTIELASFSLAVNAGTAGWAPGPIALSARTAR